MKTLLVIDDDETILLLFEAFLGRSGYRVLRASDGHSGIARFREHTPDAVICDLRMPGGGGLTVLAEVKALSPYTPFVVMSGTTDIREATQALALGAWDFLIKPFATLEILPPVLERLAERAELLQQKDRYQARLEAEIAERTVELKRQLAEKDLLLAEVHHRVKNNLQIMLILLGLQQEQSRSTDVTAVLAEIQSRLQTLALIQEEVHDDSGSSSIDSAPFLTNLLMHNLQVFGLGKLVKLDLEVEDLSLAPGTAFTLGLVVNELLSTLARSALSGAAGGLAFRFRRTGAVFELRLVSDLPLLVWMEAKASPARELLEALLGQGGGSLVLDEDARSVTVTYP